MNVYMLFTWSLHVYGHLLEVYSLYIISYRNLYTHTRDTG